MSFSLLLFNLLIEIVFILGFPLIYLVMAIWNYTEAIKPKGKDTRKGIVIHAASMGEVAAIKTLVLALKEANPDTIISITTTTKTGLQQARAIHKDVSAWISVLDVLHLRFWQLNKLNPGLICVVETEIWPNMLLWAYFKKVPVLFINARMSERTHKYYKLLRPVFESLSKPIAGILAQSPEDTKRFSSVFAAPVKEYGNLKFSVKLPDYEPLKTRQNWGFAAHDFIVCFGSSRPGEEELMLSVYNNLRQRIPELKLILAIRHPNRLKELLPLLGKSDYILYSMMKENKAKDSGILVIDVLGVLNEAYAICDVAIVGGSFYDFGGHNPLEPACYGKAIIMGTHYKSCKDSVKQLESRNGILLSDKDSLQQSIERLYNDKDLRIAMGNNAKQVLSDNAETLERYVSVINATRRK